MNTNALYTPRSKKILAISSAVLAIIAMITIVILVLRQPSRDDYSMLKNNLLPQATESQEKLGPALNKYLATFKRYEDETGSISQAKQKATRDFEAFKQAESKARNTLDALDDSKAANDAGVGQSVKQLAQIYSERTDYFSSLVDSYADYRALFAGKNNDICDDVFVGKVDDFADRKQRLQKAATNCYSSLATLKSARNEAFSDYAKKLEKRILLMESDASAIAASEEKYQSFLPQRDDFVRQFEDAERRQASAEEYNALRVKIEAMNKQIADNQAVLDFSAKRYTSTVEEIPSLFEAVFSTHVPQKLKYFTSLSDVRVKTLRLSIENQLVAN